MHKSLSFMSTILLFSVYTFNYGMITELPEEIQHKIIEDTGIIPNIVNTHMACKAFYIHIDSKKKMLDVIDRVFEEDKWRVLSMSDRSYEGMLNHFFDCSRENGYTRISELENNIRRPYAEVQFASIGRQPIKEKHSGFVKDMFIYFFGIDDKDNKDTNDCTTKLNLLLCNPRINPHRGYLGTQYCISYTVNIFDYMVSKKNFDAARWFISHNFFKDNYFLEDGQSLLSRAVDGQNLEIVNYLLDLVDDINALDTKGVAPLHCAAAYEDSSEIVQSLMSCDAVNPNVVDRWGATPLHKASEYNCTKIAKIILSDKRTNPNLVGRHLRSRNTPLHVAVLNESKSVIKVLLADGRTDQSIVCRNNFTALETAKHQGKNNIIKPFSSINQDK